MVLEVEKFPTCRSDVYRNLDPWKSVIFTSSKCFYMVGGERERGIWSGRADCQSLEMIGRGGKLVSLQPAASEQKF